MIVSKVQENRILVQVMSHGMTVMGDIVLPSFTRDISGFTIRLMEMFNNPKLSTNIYGRIIDNLVLENAQVVPDHEETIYSERRIYLRREKIICAFQLEENAQRTKPAYETGAIEQKRCQQKERVMILMKNGIRVQGDYFKGTNELSRNPVKPFFAVADAELVHNLLESKTLHAPFIILNHEAVVAFWPLAAKESNGLPAAPKPLRRH